MSYKPEALSAKERQFALALVSDPQRCAARAAERASWSHELIGVNWTPAAQTLTEGQANAITNYANLSFIFTGREGGGGGATSIQVSWAELNTPDAPDQSSLSSSSTSSSSSSSTSSSISTSSSSPSSTSSLRTIH